MTPEEYIKAYTRGHSNELVNGGYHEWLTPENALAAVELARKEMKEPASEDLEQAANDLTKIYAGEGCVDPKREGFAFHVGFKNGAKWQKEQMLKDAISGFVVEMLNIDGGVAHKYVETDFLPAKEYEKGQEVKVIIIKE